MNNRYYLLGQNNNPYPVQDIRHWAENIDSFRRVALDKLPDDVTVSTVFLGMNHNYTDGPPILFETLVFEGPLDGEMERYYTWDEAIAGHEAMVNRCKIAARKSREG